MIHFNGRSDCDFHFPDEQLQEVVLQMDLEVGASVPVVFVVEALEQLAGHGGARQPELLLEASEQAVQQVREQPATQGRA